MTCSDVKRLGDGLTGLRTEQLTLVDAEFINCAETLGAELGFSTIQKEALAAVATRPTVSARGCPTIEHAVKYKTFVFLLELKKIVLFIFVVVNTFNWLKMKILLCV